MFVVASASQSIDRNGYRNSVVYKSASFKNETVHLRSSTKYLASEGQEKLRGFAYCKIVSTC